MNDYHLEIVANLRAKRNEVERNYESFRKEYDRLNIMQSTILHAHNFGDDEAREFSECSNSLRATFESLERLHQESQALHDCIRAIEKLC
jgi:uncharacterized coiled-coil DUF342 family protein